jgi:hypothetical protein
MWSTNSESRYDCPGALACGFCDLRRGGGKVRRSNGFPLGAGGKGRAAEAELSAARGGKIRPADEGRGAPRDSP